MGRATTVLALMVLLHATICGGPPLAQAAGSPGHGARTAIRDFAWLDATYDFGDGSKTTFSGGYSAELDSDGACNVCRHIRALNFGDVDGDGKEEALIVVSDNLGGAGTNIEGHVFGLEHGAPVWRATIEGGDRGDGGIESMVFKNGVIVVRRFDLASTDGNCCPSLVEIEKWRWSDHGLQKVGPSKRVRRAPTPWSSSRR